jgi:hypothetical protein
MHEVELRGTYFWNSLAGYHGKNNDVGISDSNRMSTLVSVSFSKMPCKIFKLYKAYYLQIH